MIFAKLCLARFRQGDQILFPRERVFFSLLEQTLEKLARFSFANTLKQKKKAIGGKITKRRLFMIYKKTYPEWQPRWRIYPCKTSFHSIARTVPKTFSWFPSSSPTDLRISSPQRRKSDVMPFWSCSCEWRRWTRRRIARSRTFGWW